MNIFQRIYYALSQYTDPTERMIAKFLGKISEKNVNFNNFDKLTSLVQLDLVVLNLWSERNFKGYDYLTKAKRSELYANAKLILNDFEGFVKNNQSDIEPIISKISQLGIHAEKIKHNQEKIIYLSQIMRYLSINSGRYAYRASSSFGELLKDPTKNVLQGDCNQIVTLYIYLYSRRFKVTDLRLKTYPGHVALHYEGVDIEATNGEFAHYEKPDQKILPVHEIVSINLMDTTDSYFQTHKIDPKTILQSARIAYLLSSEKEVVKNNLDISYHNLVNDLMQKSDYGSALKYAKLSGQDKLIKTVGHNGAAFYMNNNKFDDAKKYVEFASDQQDLIKKINYNQGINYFNKHEFQAAINAFRSIGETELIKKCYKGLYFEEQKKLSNIHTTDELKQNKSIVNRLHDYAQKSGDEQLIKHADSLSKSM